MARYFVLCVLSSVLFFAKADLRATPELRSEYFQVDNHTYYVGTDFLDWNGAAAKCNSLDMKLISFKTINKFEKIEEYLLKYSLYNERIYWTSGVKIMDSWHWTGIGETFDYTNWNTDMSQPDSPNECDVCMTLAVGNQWWDDKCTLGWNYLCE